ncbi:M67 family peptidase [Deinococcus psychrotolerans]|uniref:M67 family peptidase n=1 Tax=Deinococcus psychrotolerans TaxID=2489213 RepID=A0A3G8YBB1_9DEIO|nr:M67 family metallopeptidase [Deinococcus psychrotolerans]AZI41487.1 M67 family peptidase [Deinococcus psychrotolerans]
MSDAAPRLLLPRRLETQLWQHARRDAPQECVGVLGGWQVGDWSVAGGGWQASRLYPLVNRAAHPQREYLAEAAGLLRALKSMRAEALELVAIYHSHPHGPAHFSLTDQQQAAYDVPYLIADLFSGHLSAYLLPEGVECELRPDE